MTVEENIFFALVDDYARSNFRCFLAEMSLRSEQTGYHLCFRPLDGTVNSPRQYACKYLLVPVDQVTISAVAQTLLDSLLQQLDPELSYLRHLG
jgi:hypothetical protein